MNCADYKFDCAVEIPYTHTIREYNLDISPMASSASSIIYRKLFTPIEYTVFFW